MLASQLERPTFLLRQGRAIVVLCLTLANGIDRLCLDAESVRHGRDSVVGTAAADVEH